MPRTQADKTDKINELSRQILQVCARCPHGKWVRSAMICDRKKSECHSKRVRKWLEEIEKLKREAIRKNGGG